MHPMFPQGPRRCRTVRTVRSRFDRSFTRLLLLFCPEAFQASYWALCAAFRARFLALRRFFASDFAFLLIGTTRCRIEELAERAAGDRTRGGRRLAGVHIPEPPANRDPFGERVTSSPHDERHARGGLVFCMGPPRPLADASDGGPRRHLTARCVQVTVSTSWTRCPGSGHGRAAPGALRRENEPGTAHEIGLPRERAMVPHGEDGAL